MTQFVLLPNLGAPNKNNRVYTKEAVQEAIFNLNETIPEGIGLPGRIGSGVIENYGQVAFVVKDIRIEDNNLVGEVIITDGGLNLAIMSTSEEFGFRPSGTGNIDENGVVSDYRIDCINFVRDPA